MRECKTCSKIKTEDEFKTKKGYKCYDCVLLRQRQYKKEHSEEIYEKRKVYLKENAKHTKERYRKYCENNKDRLNQIAKHYRNTHIGSKLRDNLSRRLRQKLNKNDLTYSYLGIKVGIIKQWLESHFTKEMCWDNYGSLWHIDHVFPINKFDLENEEHIAICFNWKNLYPMNAFDNKSKSDSINISSFLFQELKVKHFCIQKQIEDNITEYFKKYQYIATHLVAGNSLEP